MFARRIATERRRLQHFVDVIDEALMVRDFRIDFRPLMVERRAQRP